MSSKLFAFQLSHLAEPSIEPMSRKYDPQTQTMVWQGGTPAQAPTFKIHCTPLRYAGEEYCEQNGEFHCVTYGNVCPEEGWSCDSTD